MKRKIILLLMSFILLIMAFSVSFGPNGGGSNDPEPIGTNNIETSYV